MKIFFGILCMALSGMFVFNKPAINRSNYTLYPYFLLDSQHLSTGGIVLPLRSCLSKGDTQYVYFVNITSLKFNEYKSLPFKQFDSDIVTKICNGECVRFDTDYRNWNMVKITSEEYNSLNPDSLLLRYFKPDSEYFRVSKKMSWKWGNINNDDSLPSRNVLLAMVVLFDNKYIIDASCANPYYMIDKAPTDDEIRRSLEKNK